MFVTGHSSIGIRRPSGAWRAGFTLVEMIAVITLIAIFAGVIGYAFMRGGGSSVGLQGAQSAVSGLVTLARSQAAISGTEAGFVVCANSDDPERYLRFVVVVVRDSASPSTWKAVTSGELLPKGVYVLPPGGPANAPSGPDLREDTSVSWKRQSDSDDLRSSALQGSEFTSVAIMSTAAEAWHALVYTPRGTPKTSGDIVLATGRPNSPGSVPVILLTNPDNVRGMSISAYGMSRMINNRQGF